MYYVFYGFSCVFSKMSTFESFHVLAYPVIPLDKDGFALLDVLVWRN